MTKDKELYILRAELVKILNYSRTYDLHAVEGMVMKGLLKAGWQPEMTNLLAQEIAAQPLGAFPN